MGTRERRKESVRTREREREGKKECVRTKERGRDREIENREIEKEMKRQ